MSFRIHMSLEAERALEALPSRRARDVREGLLQRLEEVARLVAMRRFGDEAEAERFHLRVGAIEAHYSVNRSAGTVTLLEVVRLPSTRARSVG